MTATTKPYTTVTNYRICGYNQLIPLYSLGEQHINGFPKPGEDHDVVCPKCPIDIYLCPQCTLVQNVHTAPQELLYSGNYWYRSGVTKTMRDALQELADEIRSRVDLKPGDVVLDIGSNDGTLLRNFPGNLVRVGVEPANNLATEENYRGLHLIHSFWNAGSYFSHYLNAIIGFSPFPLIGRKGGGKAKVITAIGMFYDLDNPNQFIADVAKSLAPDGVFVCQLMCLKQMIEAKDVGNLAHEHLEFYSLYSLSVLLGRHGLEMYDLSENKVNGGSYRIYCRHKAESGTPIGQSVYNALRVESEMRLFDPATHNKFFNLMEANKIDVYETVRNRVEDKGCKVFVYGASTKGNTLLQYYGLDHTLIECAAERSPEKYGRETVGTKIPIVSEEEARAKMPDYFLVLPYAFLQEFRHREVHEAWRCNGGKFIVPLPELRVL